MPSSTSPLTEWARVLMDALQSSGIRDVVISPGSRSTPLVWAAMNATELRCHSIIDERSAGFFALGLTRASGRPVLLVCTSGSAAAHYLPALVEATYSHQPLVALTADRPAELQRAGASQTIDQVDLYGCHVRACFQLGDPSGDPAALAALARKAAQAVHAALSPYPAPVHLNFPANKPLEPDDVEPVVRPPPASLSSTTPAEASRSPKAPRIVPARLVANTQSLDELAVQLAREPNLLVSLGPVEHQIAAAAAKLCQRLGLFLLCELPGFATPVEGIARLYQRRNGHEPLPPYGHVVHIGPPPLSSRWQGLLERGPGKLAILCDGPPVDPTHRAHFIGTGELGFSLDYLERRLSEAKAPAGRSEFTRRYENAAAHSCAVARSLLAHGRLEEPMSEPAAVLALLDALPKDSQLFLGNSLPIRVAAWMAPLIQARPPRVHTQRGASGIDGLIAGAAGLCMASKKPTAVLLGDVSAAHDLSSLAIARDATAPLAICVVDNDGGRIFDHLPLAQRMAGDRRFSFWTTPPKIDWVHAAAAYGVAHVSPPSLDQFGNAIRDALSRDGATLLVVRTDTDSSRQFWAEHDAAAAEQGK